MKEKNTVMFTCSKDDVSMMLDLVKKIYSIKRAVFLLFCFLIASIVLTVMLDITESAPIIIFCYLITIMMGIFLLAIMVSRPRLIGYIKNSEGHDFSVSFNPSAIAITEDRNEALYLTGKDIRSQFWLDDRYFLLYGQMGSQKLICIPVNGDSFDLIARLATGLAKQRKNLISIKRRAM